MFYVYKITNKMNGKVYIGKATNLLARWAAHRTIARHPKNKKHFLIHKAMNKYGEENFSFEKVEAQQSEKITLDREQYWISFYKSNVSKYGIDFGYNLTDGGESNRGYKHTEENKQLMSLLKQGLYDGEKHHNWGKNFSDETKVSISNNRNGKLLGADNHQTKLDITDIPIIRSMILQGISERKIATKFSVSRNTISNIRSGKTWKQVP